MCYALQGLDAAFYEESQSIVSEPTLEQISAAVIEYVQALSRDELGASSLPRPSPLTPAQLTELYPDGLPVVPVVYGVLGEVLGHVDNVSHSKEDQVVVSSNGDVAVHEGGAGTGEELCEGSHPEVVESLL